MFKEVSISSVSGNISLEIPENNGFRVQYNTVSGDLTSEFNLDNYTYKRDSAEVIVKTTSGDLNIEK